MKKGVLFTAIILSIILLPGCQVGGEYSEQCRLPVLLYHHFAEEVTADTVVSPQMFRAQITVLKEAGYSTVTLAQIIAYVDQGTPLPDKPVLITIDDGYTSNLTIAAPILEELGMCATVFVIGIFEGESINPLSGNPMYPPRFSYEEALPWIEKGVLDLQSHTYNMHQLSSDGFSDRNGILRMDRECADSYRAALQQDAEHFAARRSEHGITSPLIALAYPYGYFTGESADILQQLGFVCTFTVAEHANTLRVGDRSCLWNLGRFNVTERSSGKSLVDRLKQ